MSARTKTGGGLTLEGFKRFLVKQIENNNGNEEEMF